MEENGNHKTIPGLHIDTQVIVKRLAAAKAGETVTYDELQKLIGQDVRPGAEAYVRLLKARDVLEKDPDKRIVFAAVNKEGIKRLNDSEIVESGSSFVGLVRRTARRGLRRLTCVNYDKLTNGERVKHNAAASHLGVLHEITKPSAVKKIEAGVEKSHEKMATAKTLEFFTAKEG